MNIVSCYDAISMVLDDALTRFGTGWRLNQDALKRLKADCRDLDAVVQDFNCDSIEAEVDEETMELSVSLFCDEMTLEYGRTHPFFAAIRHAKSFGFRNSGEDGIVVTIIFGNLFVRT